MLVTKYVGDFISYFKKHGLMVYWFILDIINNVYWRSNVWQVRWTNNDLQWHNEEKEKYFIILKFYKNITLIWLQQTMTT